jgi:hypothetical protein
VGKLITYVKKYLFLRKRLANFFFFLLNRQFQKLCFDVHFNNITSKILLRRYPTPPPPPIGFTATSDHLRVGEVLMGCGRQFGTAPVRIPMVTGRTEGEQQILSQACSLAFSQRTHVLHWSGQIPEIVGLYHTKQIWREVN